MCVSFNTQVRFGQLISLQTHFWLLTQVIIWAKRITDKWYPKSFMIIYNITWGIKTWRTSLETWIHLELCHRQHHNMNKAEKSSGEEVESEKKQEKYSHLALERILSSICVFVTSSHLSQGWHCQGTAASRYRSWQGQRGVSLWDFRKVTAGEEWK